MVSTVAKQQEGPGLNPTTAHPLCLFVLYDEVTTSGERPASHLQPPATLLRDKVLDDG